MSFSVAFVLTPIVRQLALNWNILDRPTTDIKTHATAVPYLGGVAIVAGVTLSLILFFCFHQNDVIFFLKLYTPLFALFAVGSLDDVYNFSARFRFFLQFIIFFFVTHGLDLRLVITGNFYFDELVTLVWLVGITNAFNIIDIMDGLSSGVAIIISTFLFFFSFRYGQTIPAVLALSTCGGVLGFIRYNYSKRFKIFMGDGGSTFLGGILGTAAVFFCRDSALPTLNFIPIVVLFGIPVYDTILVSILRIKKGLSPFKGSRDHFALRMVAMGFSRLSTVFSAYIVTVALGLTAFVMLALSPIYILSLLAAISLLGITWGRMLSIVDVKN